MTTPLAHNMLIMSLSVLVLLIVKIECMPAVGQYPSGCSNFNCLPQPGSNCWASYDRDDHCCPVWHCTDNYGNNFESYGKGGMGGTGNIVSFSNNGGSGYSSSFSSSSSSSGEPPLPLSLPAFNFGGGRSLGGGPPSFPGFSFPSLGFMFG